jgi:copper chaperone CopZ
MNGTARRWVLRIPQVAAIAAITFLAGGAAPRAEVRRVVFPVKGMICPLCTRGVEEAIRPLPGVASVTADLASGRVEVQATPPASLDIKTIRDRAAHTGFPAIGESDIEARGRFDIGAEGKITFKVTGTKDVWQVIESNGLLAMFRAYPTLKGDFVVEFRLHDRAPAAKATISVTRGLPAPALTASKTPSLVRP